VLRVLQVDDDLDLDVQRGDHQLALGVRERGRDPSTGGTLAWHDINEIAFVPLAPFVQWGVTLGPEPVVRMAVVAVLTAVLIVLFYKELLVTSFDPGLARSLGINSGVMHYALMSMLSVVVVSAFESVGAILVIAMLITPGAIGYMLSDRFNRMMVIACVSSVVQALPSCEPG